MEYTYDIRKISDLLFACQRRERRFHRNISKSTYLSKFAEQKTNSDKVEFIYNDLKKYNLLPKFIKKGKDDRRAAKSREKGNDKFRNMDCRDALFYYTKSITQAKTDTTLAIAYANRSAALYDLGKYAECLEDIERALAHNYPDNLKPKLIKRRENAQRYSSKHIERFYEKVPTIPDSRKHKQIKCAKDCIDIKTDKNFGRHVVATRDIQIGEVICVERPFVATVDDPNLLHCEFCLELCYNPLPCENCSAVVFCSTSCRLKALGSFHNKFECQCSDTLETCVLTSSMIQTLRLAILAKEYYSDSDEKIQPSGKYEEILNLKEGLNCVNIPVEVLLKNSINAAIVYHFLEKINFFEDSSEVMKNVFKDLSLTLVLIIRMNQLLVYTYISSRFNSYNPMRHFAMGLYPFASLFNHSCCPNVEYAHHGSTIVLRAVNSIKNGQQCFISYGAACRYQYTNRTLRLRFLKCEYYFDCKCLACEEDWCPWTDLLPFKFPLYMDLEMSDWEVDALKGELLRGDVDTAKKYLPRLISQLKRHETFEPWGNALFIKELVIMCFKIFGNKVCA